MKKLLIIILATMMLIAAVGCEKQDPSKKQVDSGKEALGTNEIREVQLSDTEQIVFANNNCFSYDFNVDSTYHSIKVWVDKYEFGKYVGSPVGILIDNIKNDGKIVFVMENINANIPEYEYLFRLGVKGNNGTSSTTSIQPNINGKEEGMLCSWQHKWDEIKPIKDKMILTIICCTKGNQVTSLSDEFYDNPNAHMDELKPYDAVYLLRCEFEKDKKV